MPIPRLEPESTCLLVVDVQERLIGEMHEAERLVNRCRFLVQCAAVLGVPTVVTEQYVKGLGHTVESIRGILSPEVPVFEKTRFSACTEPVLDWIEATGRPNVLLCGMEAHVCVLQSGLDLLEAGKIVFPVLDAISGGEADQIAPAIERLARGGSIVTGCTSMAYEMMRDAAHPSFRACLPLVKALRSGK